MKAGFLDRCAQPTIFGRSSYVVLGSVGALVGLVLSQLVATGATVASRCAVGIVPPISLLVSLVLGRAGWIPRRIVFYEKAVIALASTALVLAILRAPIMAGLDIAMIGVGSFLAIGRLGCFCVACCHGKRARVGVRYRWHHAAGGFPARWIGMTLFPIQLVDSVASASAVAVATVVQLSPHEAGIPLAVYVCMYGACRFAIELARGDDLRRYLAGVSEAQWTALLTIASIAMYRSRWWVVAVAIALTAATIIIALARRSERFQHVWLTSARHLAEIDRVLGQLVVHAPPRTTTEGLEMSLRSCGDGAFELALAHRRGLSARTARAIGAQLGRSWTVLDVHGCELIVAARVPQNALVA